MKNIDLLLEILNKIWMKYRALMIPVYACIMLYFAYLVGTWVLQQKDKAFLFDNVFISKQIQKIQSNPKDFYTADIDYIEWVCATYHDNISISRKCKIIFQYIEKKQLNKE
ncbi:MAG: hypothetical protein FWE18_00150 [Alphaproteobacteria bacterium]|nr:hypothetical protein [Alphaproteobacteria bacterium]